MKNSTINITNILSFLDILLQDCHILYLLHITVFKREGREKNKNNVSALCLWVQKVQKFLVPSNYPRENSVGYLGSETSSPFWKVRKPSSVQREREYTTPFSPDTHLIQHTHLHTQEFGLIPPRE